MRCPFSGHVAKAQGGSSNYIQGSDVREERQETYTEAGGDMMEINNRNWWVYYRIKSDCIEVLSVKHALQQVRTLRDL